ncbi:MAG: CHASE3 domain-containing protein [Kiritimatiellia bacterium]|nr:CHASE3 domain-containing protein [Kiritimatiellia bacterium]
MKILLRTTGLLVGAALLGALVGASSLRAFRQLRTSAAAHKHTYEVLDRSNALLSALLDAESGQRGYALTGDESFWDPDRAVGDRIKTELTELRRLTRLPEALDSLNKLTPLIEENLQENVRIMEMRRGGDSEAVRTRVRAGLDKRWMDSIRAEMNGFIRIEEAALAQHNAAFQSDMRYLFTLIVCAGLCALLLAFSFIYLIVRE